MKYIFSVLLSFVFLVLVLSVQNVNATGNVEKVGTPHYSIGILSSTYGIGPNGENATFAISNGDPAILNVINTKIGENISTHSLEGALRHGGRLLTLSEMFTLLPEQIFTVMIQRMIR